MMLIPWLHVFLGSVPTFGLIRKPDFEFRNFIESTINEKLATGPIVEKAHDIVGSLMGSTVDRVHLSQHEIVSNAVILTLAGADTTLSSMTHLEYRLARHPETQEILQQEVSAVLSHGAGPGDWPAISKLPYLDAFVRETL